ncbi:MAG: ankyrin repeat domain-containing protein [Propionibacteriaceae bacterium]|jgi:hypothetical protein|nr:ankyrin repeat domain-containing protein [Propionibacteriaceae bacterium]
MGDLRMNEASGAALYKFCCDNSFEFITDIGEFIETVGIYSHVLQQYFSGQSDMTAAHVASIARACGREPRGLRGLLEYEYEVAEERERRKKKLETKMEKAQVKRQKKAEEEAWRNERMKEILVELAPFGITRIQDDSRDCPIRGYYPIKFVLYYLNDEEYLPVLEEYLSGLSDDDLVYEDSNALMWGGHELYDQKLALLADRKEFIQAHVADSGPKGRTALHYAASSDESCAPEAMTLLVEWGADVNAQDDYGWTPLHDVAVRNSRNHRSWETLERLGARSIKNAAGDTPGNIQDRLDAIDAW